MMSDHMQDEQAKTPTPSFRENQVEPNNEEKGEGAGVAIFISVIALCVAIVAGYLSYQSTQHQSQFEKQLTEDKKSQQSLINQNQQALAQIAQLKTQHERALNDLKNAVQQSQSNVTALTHNKNWLLTEINHNVLMENERLRMTQDIPTVISQLEQAEKHLQNVDDPALLTIKESLAKDIAKLRMIPQINRQEIWSQLETISHTLPQIPFKNVENTSPTNKWLTEKELPPNTPAWQKGLWRSWYELKDLIRVSREDKNPVTPLLTVEEKAPILHAMQFMCEQAQWALLHGDNQIYTDNLRMLQEWIKKYMAPSKEQEQVLKQIQSLSEISVKPPDVNLSDTLQSLSRAQKAEQAGSQ